MSSQGTDEAQPRGNVAASLSRLDSLFSGSTEFSARVFWIAFVVVVLVATVFRFSNAFANTLWMDEAVSAGLSRLPLDVIMFNKIDVHPPLSFVVQHIWMKLVPDPTYYRAPVAFVGSLTIPILMLALKGRVATPVVLLSGLFLAIMTGHIYYSQDLRPYAFVPLGVVIAIWGALGLQDQDKPQTHRIIHAGLYALGGAIAIYSQVIGLIAMACAGTACLVGGLVATRSSRSDMLSTGFWWLLANFILLLLALPGLLALADTALNHRGLGGGIPISEAPWHFRLMVGYAGLEGAGKIRDIAELLGLASATLGGIVAWRRGHFSVSALIFSLLIVYPAIIGLLHMSKPLIHVRIFIPAAIGMALGMGYLVGMLSNAFLRYGGASVLAGFGLWSSTFEQIHHHSIEDYGAAYVWLEEKGYGDAPLVGCFDFSSAAQWEADPSKNIIVAMNDGAYRYPGPEYWGLMGVSVVHYLDAGTRERAEFIDKSDYFEGGLTEALQGEDKAVIAHAGCLFNEGNLLEAQMEEAGFDLVGAHLVPGRSVSYPIMVGNGTRMHLYEARK